MPGETEPIPTEEELKEDDHLVMIIRWDDKDLIKRSYDASPLKQTSSTSTVQDRTTFEYDKNVNVTLSNLAERKVISENEDTVLRMERLGQFSDPLHYLPRFSGRKIVFDSESDSGRHVIEMLMEQDSEMEDSAEVDHRVTESGTVLSMYESSEEEGDEIYSETEEEERKEKEMEKALDEGVLPDDIDIKDWLLQLRSRPRKPRYCSLGEHLEGLGLIDAHIPQCVEWSKRDVKTWLTNLGLCQYTEAIDDNNINGKKLILLATPNNLIKMGINVWSDIKVLTQAVRELLLCDDYEAYQNTFDVPLPGRMTRSLYLLSAWNKMATPCSEFYLEFLERNGFLRPLEESKMSCVRIKDKIKVKDPDALYNEIEIGHFDSQGVLIDENGSIDGNNGNFNGNNGNGNIHGDNSNIHGTNSNIHGDNGNINGNNGNMHGDNGNGEMGISPSKSLVNTSSEPHQQVKAMPSSSYEKRFIHSAQSHHYKPLLKTSSEKLVSPYTVLPDCPPRTEEERENMVSSYSRIKEEMNMKSRPKKFSLSHVVSSDIF